MIETILIQKADDNINIHYEGTYSHCCLMVYKFIEDLAKEVNKDTEDILIDIGRFR